MQPTVASKALALILFLAAALTDAIDGYVARKYDLQTNLGKLLDPIADKVLVLGVLFTFAHMGLYSAWWVFLIAFRESFITIVRIRMIRTGLILAAEMSGKVKTNLQIISIVISYFYLMLRDHSALTSMASGLGRNPCLRMIVDIKGAA